jgi:hypothetical protein
MQKQWKMEISKSFSGNYDFAFKNLLKMGKHGN